MNSEPVDTVKAFITAMNKGAIADLADLMTEDHTFVDSGGRVQFGRDEMTAAWKSYFHMFPDYKVEVDRILQDDTVVSVLGSTSATYNGKRGLVPENRVGGPAAWKAIVHGGKVRTWQVYADWTQAMEVINADTAAGQPQPGRDPQTAGSRLPRRDGSPGALGPKDMIEGGNSVSRTEQKPAAPTMTTESRWRGIYVVGGITALLVLVGTLTDIAIRAIPGWDASNVPVTMQAWFTQFRANPLLGLRNLDLLNVTISAIGIPMQVALFGAHRRVCRAYAALALIVMLVGTVVFMTSNAALPMLELSKQYSAASTVSQRLTLEAAGQALLAKGAHGSLGAFMGVFLSSIGALLMGLAMLTGRVFSRVTACLGIVGITVLIIYAFGSTFVPESRQAMMVIAISGGVLMMAWNVMVARRLFQLR